jgi:hypothetical protein
MLSRNKSPRPFDPALLCRRGIALTEVLPVLPANATVEIKIHDDFAKKHFWEMVCVPAIPAAMIVAALLAFIAPLPH